MRAKSFFYVCAGLFLLALGYHFGARNAAADYVNGFFFTEGTDGQLRVVYPNGSAWSVIASAGSVRTEQLASVPPTNGQVVACDGYWALTSTGYIWFWEGGVWRGMGYAPSGPTPAHRESMGIVKARYR